MIGAAYGLRLAADFPLAGLRPVPGGSVPDVELRLVSGDAVRAAWSGSEEPPRRQERVRHDGCRGTIERGLAGDHRLAYDDGDAFHVDAAGGLLLCAPVDPQGSAWRREALDTALATVALVRGHEALHAAAVVWDGGLLALAAGTGGGKTTLLAELLARGGELMADDVLALARDEAGAVLGLPAPAVVTAPAPAAARLPGARRLAALGDEEWLELPSGAVAPAPVRAVCVLERSADGPTHPQVESGTLLDVLAHAIDTGPAPERRAARFALLGELAEQAAVWRLHAAPEAIPAALADALEKALR